MTHTKFRHPRFFVPVVLLTFGLAAFSPAHADVGGVDLQKICRAATAVLFGPDVSIIVAGEVKDGVVQTRYARPDDGVIWKNQCKVEGDKVIWAGVDIDYSGQGPGRWRTEPSDEVISFAVQGENIEITMKYFDGSETKRVVEFN
jgi:hypothetical protein